jgi:hypothetical protein
MSKIPKSLREPLKKLILSHDKLASEEYDRNGAYTSEHFSYIAETAMIEWLVENDQDFLNDICKPNSFDAVFGDGICTDK